MERISIEDGIDSTQTTEESERLNVDAIDQITPPKEKKKRKRFLQSKEKRYNHTLEFLDIEKDTISLVEQLKQRIDSGYYDVIISDEVGGRIPALVIKKIIDERKSVTDDKEIRIYFLNFGRENLDEEAIGNFLTEVDLRNKKILFVTEAIESGKVIAKAISLLEANDIRDVEIATIVSAGNQGGKFLQQGRIDEKTGRWYGNEIIDNRSILGKKVFSGRTFARIGPQLDRSGPKLTGVEKIIIDGNIVGSHPQKIKPIQSMNIPDYRANKIGRVKVLEDVKKMSDEELQESVNMAREDVDSLAKVILKKVWKK